MSSSAPRDTFFGLGPEQVLDAVEAAGLATRPVCYPLNSFENRVYEVELEDRSRVVAKFYRPGRWTREQILEEHEFLRQLDAEEIPVCTVRPFPDGETLKEIAGIYYSISDRRGGRAPDELSDAALERLGMFVGRMHAVGVRRPFRHRPALDVERYVRRPVEIVRPLLPAHFRDRWLRAADALADLAEPRLRHQESQRIHGDLHLGNVLFRNGRLRVLDFDDAATGPPVQDLWLAVPGRDVESRRRRVLLVAGYERFRLFDPSSLEVIEHLRGLRMVRYSGWLARRRDDPAFRRAWPEFGSEEYWRQETRDLEEQVAAVRAAESARRRSRTAGRPPALSRKAPEADADVSELSNADYFWDWEES